MTISNLLMSAMLLTHPQYPAFPSDTLWPDRNIALNHPPFFVASFPSRPALGFWVQPWRGRAGGLFTHSEKFDLKFNYGNGRDFCYFDTANLHLGFLDEVHGIEIVSDARAWLRKGIKYTDIHSRLQIFEVTEESTFVYFTTEAKYKKVWDDYNSFDEAAGNVDAGIFLPVHERLINTLKIKGLYSFTQKSGFGTAEYMFRWLPFDELLLALGVSINPIYRHAIMPTLSFQLHPAANFVAFGRYDFDVDVPVSPDADFVSPSTTKDFPFHGIVRTLEMGYSLGSNKLFKFSMSAERRNGENLIVLEGDSIPTYSVSNSFSLTRMSISIERKARPISFKVFGNYVFSADGIYNIPMYSGVVNLEIFWGRLSVSLSSNFVGERKPSESAEPLEPYRIDNMALSLALPYNFETKFSITNLLGKSPEIYRGWKYAGRQYEFTIIWKK